MKTKLKNPKGRTGRTLSQLVDERGTTNAAINGPGLTNGGNALPDILAISEARSRIKRRA